MAVTAGDSGAVAYLAGTALLAAVTAITAPVVTVVAAAVTIAVIAAIMAVDGVTTADVVITAVVGVTTADVVTMADAGIMAVGTAAVYGPGDSLFTLVTMATMLRMAAVIHTPIRMVALIARLVIHILLATGTRPINLHRRLTPA